MTGMVISEVFSYDVSFMKGLVLNPVLESRLGPSHERGKNGVEPCIAFKQA